MQIKVLGTSATWPLPHRKCKCLICSSSDRHDKRMRSAILIRDNDLKILIDCGPDIIKELRREKILKIDYIILTHSHSDHTSGLKSINPHKLHKENFIPIYALFSVHQKIKNNFGEKLKYKKIVIKPYKKFKINSLEFLSLPVFHSENFPTLALKIISKSSLQASSIVYMPDYKEVPESSKKFMKNVDVLILGGAVLHHSIPWHNSIDSGIKLAKELNARKIYFTHIGHKTLPHKKLVGYVQKIGSKNFNVLYDGQIINI